jgi:hypothetical protein
MSGIRSLPTAKGRGPAVLWAALFALATALSWLIPPMQSPDESSHITRAYLISTGQWLLEPPQPELQKLVERYRDIPMVAGFVQRLFQHGGRAGGPVDLALLDYVDAYRAWPGVPLRKFSDQEAAQLAAMPWRGTSTYFVAPGTGYYFPAVYAPQALGLWLGRAAGWSVDHSYRLARGFTLLASGLLLWLAFRLVRPSPLALAVLLLPMSLFQLLSPTLDGLTTALAVWCISQFLVLATQPRPPRRRVSIALALGLLLLATTRTHLLVLLALPFLLAWRHRSRHDLPLGAAASVCALAWTLFAMTSTADVLVPRSFSSSELLRFYLAHPVQFVRVLAATWTDGGSLQLYQQSFIGVLGALDVPLPPQYYPLLWAGLGLCAMASVTLPASGAEGGARAALAGLALGAMLLIFLALLITWTPHPARLVQGVQGRYFVVPALLLAYVLAGLGPPSPWRLRLNLALAGGFGALSLGALTTTLLTRYH